MDLVRFLGAVLERPLGSAGAVHNCRAEREARALVEAEIELLQARLTAADPPPQQLSA
jgi:hypothetical protein